MMNYLYHLRSSQILGQSWMSLHISFEFARNTSAPQPGPLYFSSQRKVHLFEVCCEAILCQVNYIMDEANYTRKGANITILEHHGLREKHLHLYADNCVGQNKSNTLPRVSYCIFGAQVVIHGSSLLIGASACWSKNFTTIIKLFFQLQ